MSPVSPLLQHFSQLTDPRMNRTRFHSLETILTIAICAVISGAEDWVTIERFGKAKYPFFKTFLKLPNGIPSHDTFGRVFSALDHEAFSDGFISWVQSLCKHLGPDVVAIDGKTMRGTLDKANGKAAIDLVSAFAQNNRLVLGQVKVDDKSNEVTAIPLLLQRLALSGCLITLDAMGCQKKIAHQIITGNADYLLALKGNQGDMFDEVKSCFAYLDQDPSWTVKHSYNQTIDAGHGRVEVRTVETLDAEYVTSRFEWTKLNSIVRVHCERHVGEKISSENRYYLCSLPAEKVERISHGIRAHWSVENNLHWTLDVSFNEDHQRMRTGHAAANMALLSKIALNLLKREQTHKVGIKTRRLNAGWDNNYLLRVLTAGLNN